MGNKFATKVAIIVAVLLFFSYGVIGPHSMERARHYSPKQALADNIKLGLDLQGGIHLVLQVHVLDALNSSTDRDVQHIENELQTAGVTGVTVGKPDPNAHPETITLTGVTAAQASQVRTITGGTDYQTYDVAGQPDGSLKMTMKPQAVKDLYSRTLQQEIETIDERINALGVSEPTVQQYGLGDNEILIEMPGVSDPSQVEAAIASTSTLSIHAVIGNTGYESEQAALAANSGVLPPDAMLMKGQATDKSPQEFWVLKRASEVEGTDFRNAQSGTDINGRPNINFNLTTEAGQRFFTYTDAHKGESMAIVLGESVRQVANIRDGIRDSGQIEGNFSKDEVESLSLLLRTGALPASFTYLETRTVGPSLGAASIHQGVVAAIAGMLAVMAFMLVYYKGSGINADMALILNLIFLLGFMGFSSAVLTLPGIAGVILTIGMGVDSNVLIFERIREELRSGKTAAAAIKEGFDHALTTIIDTHVTTIVAAIILLMFGTGPVKGFAITLMVGLGANFITAVFVSRVIFDWHLEGKDRSFALSI
jgi:preprotein translocase subunit SecD